MKHRIFKPHERKMLDDLKRIRASDVLLPAAAGLVLLVLGTDTGALWAAGCLALFPLVIRASDWLAVHAARDYSAAEWGEVKKNAMEMEQRNGRSNFQGDFDYDY